MLTHLYTNTNKQMYEYIHCFPFIQSHFILLSIKFQLLFIKMFDKKKLNDIKTYFSPQVKRILKKKKTLLKTTYMLYNSYTQTHTHTNSHLRFKSIDNFLNHKNTNETKNQRNIHSYLHNIISNMRILLYQIWLR